MKGRRRLGSHSDSPSPTADLRLKVMKIVSRHEQLKAAFNQLNSQIKHSLREAEDVFTSLSLPLMKLVGLKTVEMAEEGRSSTIIIDTNSSHSQGYSGSGVEAEQLVRSVQAIQKSDNLASSLEEEGSYMNRATTAGKELRDKQKLQLLQLVHLLKQIEIQVNTSKDDILHTLDGNQSSIKKFFFKAFAHVSSIDQSRRDNGMSLVMLKLLKASYDHVDAALGSVEVGVDNLIHDLAEKMCSPMVQYIHALRGEFMKGTCTRLLTLVEEMDGAMRVKRLELQEARNRAILEEKIRVELLRKLRESEEMVRKLETRHGFVIQSSKRPEQNLVQQKPQAVVEDQSKDDKLIWELLRNKRKHQIPDSPLGPKELLSKGAHHNNHNSTGTISSVSPMAVTKSQKRGHSRLLLGSSPSANTQKVLTRKRVTT